MGQKWHCPTSETAGSSAMRIHLSLSSAMLILFGILLSFCKEAVQPHRRTTQRRCLQPQQVQADSRMQHPACESEPEALPATRLQTASSGARKSSTHIADSCHILDQLDKWNTSYNLYNYLYYSIRFYLFIHTCVYPFNKYLLHTCHVPSRALVISNCEAVHIKNLRPHWSCTL